MRINASVDADCSLGINGTIEKGINDFGISDSRYDTGFSNKKINGNIFDLHFTASIVNLVYE